MDLTAIAQIANPILQTIFIVVIGFGYYFTTRAIQRQVQEMVRESTTGGRPLIIVSEDYENLPTINLIIQNVGPGPAKNITFTFSAPVESSDGYVLSDLSIFTEGITSLAPGARIVCYWDELGNLQPMVQEGRLQRPVTVTVEYQELTGGAHSHDWEIDPSLYEGLRTFGNKSMNEVVEAVENVAQEIANDRGQSEDNRGEEGVKGAAS